MTKMCECGCGEPAPIATTTNARWGHRKGQPTRFRKGHHQRHPLPEWSDVDTAWLAGLLEGEGSFIAQGRHRRDASRFLAPRVQVGMIDLDVMTRVATMFGGAKLQERPAVGGRKQVLYVVARNGGHAVVIMTRLRDHMGERRRAQIDYALAHDERVEASPA